MSDAHVFRRRIVCRNRSCRFQVTERGSVPLPIDISHSRFGTVFRQTYRQALTGLSWLSYSQPSHFSTVPGLVSPVSSVTRRKLPTPARLHDPLARTRAPLDGIWQSTTASPTLIDGGPAQKTERGFSASPSVKRNPKTSGRSSFLDCHTRIFASPIPTA